MTDGLEELKNAMWSLNDSLPVSDAFVRPRTAEELFGEIASSSESEEGELLDDEDFPASK
jgi:hypothetical protein